jgi:spoIIIJ-associated protein
VEWVETTARTVDEAKDAALDQLGVDEQEAEFEVLEEPRSGLFGRTRGEARVRARVQPRQPRPKQERRDRRRSGSGNRRRGGGRGGSGKGAGKGSGDRKSSENAPEQAGAPTEAPGPEGSTKTEPAPKRSTGGGGNRSRRRRSGGGGQGDGRQESQGQNQSGAASSGKEQTMGDDVTVEEQADIMAEFLDGLLDAFGFDADINRSEVDDETIELDIVGEDLGLLIGPKGRTLTAVQELSRTVVQRQATGTHHGRVRIDVGGYRQRRREALQRFTQQIAEEVRESGERKALEAMGAADRKVVHDTVNELDGVTTTSEGEEPRRRVVIVPAD